MSEDNRKKFEEMMDYIAKEEGGENWSPFMTMIKGFAEHDCKRLDWDDDIMPVLFIDGIMHKDLPRLPKEVAETPGIMVVALGDALNTNAGKARLCQMMYLGAIKANAIGMALLHTIWMSVIENPGVETMEDLQKLDIPAPSEDPHKMEKVMIQACQYGGEDDGTKIAMADIKREKGKPPVLHNWKLTGGMETLGRFPQAMRAGLKAAADLRAAKPQQQEGEEWKNQ